jgi:hypothetical protein
MKKINKLQKIFKDFTSFEPKSNDYYKYVNIITVNYNPPSYVVQILLLGVLGFRNCGRMDKVLWHTYFQYKKYPFMIRDYKFGSWTIKGIQNNKKMLQLAKEILNKIIKASKVLDKVLYKELKDEIEKGNFYLNNVYHKLSSIYTFYEKKVLETIKEYEEFDKKKKITKNFDSMKYLSAKLTYEKTISNYSFALIQTFFSLLEFLLNGIYVFKQPNEKFFEFRKEHWDSKFKLCFPVSNNKKIKELYDKLLRIKRTYRNPLAHGLINDKVNILVPLSHVGLVPISYEYLSDKIYYGLVELEKDDVLRIINIFKEFLEFIEHEEPYRFYTLYFDYGFSIPMSTKEISEIKKEMTTYKNFKEYLDMKTLYEEMIVNRDI